MNKQLISILLVLSSSGCLGVTVGNQLEHVKRNRRSLTPDSNLGPISIIRNGFITLNDVYYPFFIGKELGGQELGKFKEHIHIYCEKYHPVWGTVMINVQKLLKLIFDKIDQLKSLMEGTLTSVFFKGLGMDLESLKDISRTILKQVGLEWILKADLMKWITELIGLGWIGGGGSLQIVGFVLNEVKLIADDVCANQEQVVEFAKHGRMACVVSHEGEMIACFKAQAPKLLKLGGVSKQTVLNETIMCAKKIFKACSSANQIELNSIFFTVLYALLSRYY